ncbi:sensor histidine kinase [Paenibacillus tarimensis]
MRLRTYLLIANTVSIAFILIILLASYRTMLLDVWQFMWLSIATLSAGLVSILLHFVLVRPVEEAVRRVDEGTRAIASGKLNAQVPITGPVEFKEMAERFNAMSRNLNESFNMLKASEASRRELVANLAHDLRTPLASVQSYVEALEDDVVQDEAAFKLYLRTIRNETVRLSDLLQHLFDVSALDAQVQKFQQFQPVDIALEDIVVELLPRFTNLMEEKRIDLRVEWPDFAPICRVVPGHIERVLQNLLENAIRYAPEDTPIILRAEMERPGWITVSVADRGPGIPKEEQANIFKRFYRVDRARHRESGGTGLGLAIAKTLVEQHGGAIGVESEQGGGARFWFTLPVSHAGK